MSPHLAPGLLAARASRLRLAAAPLRAAREPLGLRARRLAAALEPAHPAQPTSLAWTLLTGAGMEPSTRTFVDDLRKIPMVLQRADGEVRAFAKEWPLITVATAAGAGFLLGKLVSRISRWWS